MKDSAHQREGGKEKRRRRPLDFHCYRIHEEGIKMDRNEGKTKKREKGREKGKHFVLFGLSGFSLWQAVGLTVGTNARRRDERWWRRRRRMRRGRRSLKGVIDLLSGRTSSRKGERPFRCVLLWSCASCRCGLCEWNSRHSLLLILFVVSPIRIRSNWRTTFFSSRRCFFSILTPQWMTWGVVVARFHFFRWVFLFLIYIVVLEIMIGLISTSCSIIAIPVIPICSPEAHCLAQRDNRTAWKR